MHILRRQLLHRCLVVVDRAVDHVGFLLLQHDHARLDRIFDAETSDDTWTLLANTMASIGRLPFSSRVPLFTTLANASSLI